MKNLSWHVQQTGSGFHSIENTAVTIDGIDCEVTRVEIDIVECITGPKEVDTINAVVMITSGGSSFPTITYNYSSAATPMTTTFSSSNGKPGDTVSLAG